MSEKKNSGLQDFFKGLKTEYNKIIFPTRQDIIKETTATLVVSLLVGALIAVLDLIMKTGLGFSSDKGKLCQKLILQLAGM